MVRNYLKVALRNIRKNSFFSFINICGLALGVTAFLLIITYVQFERSYDTHLPNAERLYRIPLEISVNGEVATESAENYPGVANALLNDIPGVLSTARLYNMGYKNNVIITYDDAPGGEPIQYKHRSFMYADSAFLPMFGIEMARGDAATALADPLSIVISETYAEMYFGQEEPIGKFLHLKDDDFNDELCKVTGVFKTLPGSTHLKFDVLISYETLYSRGEWAPGRYDESWQRKDMYVYALLDENTSPDVVEKQLNDLIPTYNPGLAENNQEDRMWLQPITSIHLTSTLADEPEINGNSETVNAMLIIGLFILVIAWVNYINLSTAKAVERGREVGVRKTLGAFKRQLIIQFFVESAIVNFAAIVFAVLLVILILPFFNSLSDNSFTIATFFSGSSIAILGILWIIGTILSGIYPSLVLSSFRPATVLKGKLTTRKGGIILRKGLVIFQFVASVAMISGTLIVYDQLSYMMNKDIGMNVDQVLVVERPGISPRDRDVFMSVVDVFRNELKENTNVQDVTTSVTIPGKKREYKSAAKPYGAGDDALVTLRINSMDYDFLDVFQMELLAGRGFSEEFTNDPDTSVVLTASAIELLGFENPEDAIGKTIHIPAFNYMPIIIGVVNDYHQESLQKSMDPILFFCSLYGGEFYSMRITGNDVPATLEHVEASWNKAFPGNPFQYFFLDDYFNQQYQNEQRFQNLFGAFAILAIIVGCLGLFGLSAYTTKQRTKEIGVRKVLGSSVSGIFALLSRSYMILILISIVIGIPLSYLAMSAWLENFAYRQGISIVVFVIAALAVVIISLLTISFQTLKAARVNPVESLRYE